MENLQQTLQSIFVIVGYIGTLIGFLFLIYKIKKTIAYKIKRKFYKYRAHKIINQFRDLYIDDYQIADKINGAIYKHYLEAKNDFENDKGSVKTKEKSILNAAIERTVTYKFDDIF